MTLRSFEYLSLVKWIAIGLLLAAGGYIGWAAEDTAENKVSTHDITPQAHYEAQQAETKALQDHDDKELAHEKMRQAQQNMFDDQTTVLLEAIREAGR
jgi:predicted negative regulator of RcsB-dependent stress response